MRAFRESFENKLNDDENIGMNFEKTGVIRLAKQGSSRNCKQREQQPVALGAFIGILSLKA
jgi:hypothetical protein